MKHAFRTFQVLAVLALSAVSVYTTAIGLTFLMFISAAWIAALAIQVVLVGSAVQARAGFREAVGRGLAFGGIYLLATAFSVSGSFVAYDQVLSGARRAAETESQLYYEAIDYVTQVEQQFASLSSAVEGQAERLDRKLEYERTQGLLSHDGPGFGRRSAAIETLLRQSEAIKSEIASSATALSNATSPLAGMKAGATVADYRKALYPLREMQARLAARELDVNTLLQREASLGQILGDAPASIQLSWPTAPDLGDVDESSSSLVVIRAYTDLAAAKLGTIISMVAAILTDLLLLLVVFVSESPNKKLAATGVPAPSTDWQKGIRRYAAFMSRRQPARELELWRSFSAKILWGRTPFRILIGPMNQAELGLLEWLSRAKIIERRRGGVFVAPDQADNLNSFILDEIHRLVNTARRAS